MMQRQVDVLLSKILKSWEVYAPVQDLETKELFVSRLTLAKEADYSGKIPLNSWKQLFLPECETILEDRGKGMAEPKPSYPAVCAWNMTVLDLKALGLYDLVFANDPYYQARRDKTLVVGFSSGAPAEENYYDWKVFSLTLEENVLEHVPFDIFFEKDQTGAIKSYAGSSKGRRLLEKNGIKDYKFIKFSGLIPEEGKDKRMVDLEEKVRQSKDHPLWDELDKICLACGKCSVVCPTCFCFDFQDEANARGIDRQRLWANCFYPEFTTVAGGKSYTESPKKKLQFWYEHKFVRTPKEYKVPGCVSCNRCTLVCPVGISIMKNLAELSSPVKGGQKK